MKTPLLVSLGINAALVAACGLLLLRPGAFLPESGSQGPVAPPVVETLFAPPSGNAASPLPGAPSETLHEMDHAEQVAALVAAGWSQEDAKVFTLGQLMREGMQLMTAGHGEEYWKQRSWPTMDWETQRKMMETQHRMQEVMEDLFGMQVPGMFGTYSLPLPQEKTRAARMIQMDYHMMQTKIRQETGGACYPKTARRRCSWKRKCVAIWLPSCPRRSFLNTKCVLPSWRVACAIG